MNSRCPDARLLDRLSNLFNESATVMSQEASGYDSFGQPRGTWSSLSGHESIPCIVGTKTGGESKRSDYTPVVGNFTVLLKGYFPLIREKMRVTAGGTSYDILLVRHDTLKIITALDVQKTEL